MSLPARYRTRLSEPRYHATEDPVFPEPIIHSKVAICRGINGPSDGMSVYPHFSNSSVGLISLAAVKIFP